MGVLEVPVAPGDVRKVGCGGTGLGANLLTTNQSGFESGTTTGWAVPGGFDAVLTAVTTPTPAAGSYCMAIEHTSTTGALPFTTPTGTAGMAVPPSAAYSITAQFRTSSGGTLNCKASWYDSAGTLIVANVLGEIPWSANDTWVAQAWTDTAPAGAAFLSIEFTVEHIDVNAKRAWIDQIDVHATAGAPGRLRMQLPDGSWVREACDTDLTGRHPLKNEDPANPGTWITVACMVPVDLAPGSGWFSLVGGGDGVEEPTSVYRTDPARSARVFGASGTGNYALTLTGLTVGNTYRIGCYVRQDAASTPATSDAFFHARYATVRTSADINPMPLATWALAEATFVADSTTDDILWQIASGPPFTFSVWIADWYAFDEGP